MLCCEPHVAPGSYIYRHSPSPGAREGLLYLCYTGSYVYEPGYDLVREDFDCYLLEVVLEGSITFEAEGAVHTARQDDVVLIDCHKPHRYYTNTGCRVLWVHFDGAPADTYYQWILRMHGNVFPMRNVRKVAGSLENIYQMFHRDLGVNEARVALELTQALSAMLEAPAPVPGTEHSASIERVTAYINAHPELPLSVPELAGMAALSEYHFIRIFKAATGMTPGAVYHHRKARLRPVSSENHFPTHPANQQPGRLSVGKSVLQGLQKAAGTDPHRLPREKAARFDKYFARMT